jgi:hypothetical protein
MRLASTRSRIQRGSRSLAGAAARACSAASSCPASRRRRLRSTASSGAVNIARRWPLPSRARAAHRRLSAACPRSAQILATTVAVAGERTGRGTSWSSYSARYSATRVSASVSRPAGALSRRPGGTEGGLAGAGGGVLAAGLGDHVFARRCHGSSVWVVWVALWSRCGRGLRVRQAQLPETAGIPRGCDQREQHQATSCDNPAPRLLIRGLWVRSPRGPPC